MNKQAKAPPDWSEEAIKAMQQQYPGEPEKVFGTAWKLHNQGVSGTDYLRGKRKRKHKKGSFITMARRVIYAADPETAEQFDGVKLDGTEGGDIASMLNELVGLEIELATMYQVFSASLLGYRSLEVRSFFEEQVPNGDIGLLMDHMIAKGFQISPPKFEVAYTSDVVEALQADLDIHEKRVLPLLAKLRDVCEASEHLDTLMLVEERISEETQDRDKIAMLLAGKENNKTAE